MKKAMGEHHEMRHEGETAPYYRLAGMVALSFVAMFVLMYAMVDRFSNVYANVNQAYMAALMTAPMVIIELLMMGSMYKRRSLNVAFVSASVVVLLVAWFLIREQGAVSDRQFLRSMIPHHASAVLMCQQTALQDPELDRLCRNIVSSQQEEIAFMRAKLQGEKRAR
jgi:hypothetical protein